LGDIKVIGPIIDPQLRLMVGFPSITHFSERRGQNSLPRRAPARDITQIISMRYALVIALFVQTPAGRFAASASRHAILARVARPTIGQTSAAIGSL
jgi:hypothetical protein